MAERIRRGKGPKCFHCHMVHEALHEELRNQGRWARHDSWIWPDPIQLGLSLDGERQNRVTRVRPNSPAAKAGIVSGDTLVDFGKQQVQTLGDVMRVLHAAPKDGLVLPVAWNRRGQPMSGRIEAAAGWKQPTPLVFSWRTSKWTLSPKPGFGGPQLQRQELLALDLPPDAFAFRVGYLVTWGDQAHTGRNAQRAGIRKGDVITSVAGKRDFENMNHFHAWFRLTQQPGTEIEIGRLREGESTTIRLPVVK